MSRTGVVPELSWLSRRKPSSDPISFHFVTISFRDPGSPVDTTCVASDGQLGFQQVIPGDPAAGPCATYTPAPPPPCYDWCLMPAAEAQALADLAKPGCGSANFFGPAPAVVLAALIGGTLSGTLFPHETIVGQASIGFGTLPGFAAAVTADSTSRITHLRHVVFSETNVTVIINNTLDSSPAAAYWNAGYTSINAMTLIHELGHVYADLFGQQSTTIVHDANKDGSPNGANEARNAAALAPCNAP